MKILEDEIERFHQVPGNEQKMAKRRLWPAQVYLATQACNLFASLHYSWSQAWAAGKLPELIPCQSKQTL